MIKSVNIRVVCPSASFKTSDKEKINNIKAKLERLNYRVTFGKNVYKKDKIYGCAEIKDRVEDLLDAFKDPNVDIIICGRGGYNVNQILPYLDYELIKENKKIICGMSDNTALLLALFSKCNMKTYMGPNFLGLENDKTFENFVQMINLKTYILEVKSQGILYGSIQEGTIISANLCTLNLLQGTEYLKPTKNVILFLEDDDNYKEGAFFREFDRNLESLIQSNIYDIKGLILGRFEDSCQLNKDMGWSPMRPVQ